MSNGILGIKPKGDSRSETGGLPRPGRDGNLTEARELFLRGGDPSISSQAAAWIGTVQLLRGELAESVKRPFSVTPLDVGGEARAAGALVLDANARLIEINDNYELMLRRLEALVEEKAALAEELRRANEQLAALADATLTTVILVSRAEQSALREAARAAGAASVTVWALARTP